MEAPPAYDETKYPPPGQPGYPPAGQPGYPPAGQPGYPPPGQPGYPPPGQPGYPPPGQPGYPPPGQPGYPPPQQAPSSQTVIVTQPQAIVVQNFHGAPVQMTCTHCRQNIITSISYETGTCTWVACLGLCLIGCDLGCCLIPFCVNDCQDAVHRCPNCQNVLGRYNRM